MQPDRNPTEWQPPKEQPSQAPYVASTVEPPETGNGPVVTLTPDEASQSTPPALPMADTTPPADPPQAEPQSAQPTEMEPVRWQAHEYIHHEKNAGWFIIFSIVVLLLIAAAIFVIQSVTFAILIPVMAAALVVYSHRPPRVIDYTLSRQGLHANDTLYSFSEFKAFGVIHDGPEYSVMLLPTKRFRPGVTVYFPEEAGEAIVDMLGARLPMQELHLDAIDRLIRKLRI
ncbi:MAG TPA: hypothetical protein VL481_03650 [Verrucomicrobiae bacterium]|nr:hypothetical protein [Verrucomicrobiae bacterium]